MIFIEEGVLRGGFGEYAAALGIRRGVSARIFTLGAGDSFATLGKREELLRINGLDGEGIAATVLRLNRLAEIHGRGYSL
jgi:deoxyxylulose-5-phosphate synthase